MVYTRRQSRGYVFENKIVESFTGGGWQCRRLGGSSANNPDEIATYNEKGILLIFEAKSTVGQYCYIPVDQIERFNEIKSMFGYYKIKKYIFAFKFGNKKKKGITKYYYYIFTNFTKNDINKLSSIRCDSKGMLKPIPKNKDKYEDNIESNYDYYYIMYRCDSIEELKKDIIKIKL